MATFNSPAIFGMMWTRTTVFLLLLAKTVCAADDDQQKVFAQRAQAEYRRAQSASAAKTNDNVLTWQFARACYDYADFATSSDQRASLASQGIDACKQLLSRDAESAPGHYYLAMNMGQLAQTKTLGALKLVREMEVEFKTALDLNDHLDFGGPARSLSMLYRDAPGWPTSIGSKRKAATYLDQAMKIAPDFPENRLTAVETYLKWRDTDSAKKELDALDLAWPDAQKSFTGEHWERDWADWTKRRDDARAKLGEISGPMKSPRNGR